jgi:hypothetical protein
VQLEIVVDKTGFPMVLVEPLGVYMHWLPITKIQIEYFLCSTRSPDYTEEWYSDLRTDYNERVSPGAVTAENYWGSFLTGIMPKEAQQFASWLGPQFDMPTQNDWQEAYKFFKRTPAHAEHIEQLTAHAALNRRARTLIKNLDFSLRETHFEPRGGLTLADQMFMRMGVMEYVYLDERRSSYGGFGQTNSVFFGSLVTPDKGFPERLTHPLEGTRMRHYGFRLIQRKD